MKRTYKFEEQEDKYLVLDNKIVVFSIYKDTLKIEGNKFYEAFFENYDISDTIEIKKGESVDEGNRLSIATFNELNRLVNDIIKKIEEQKEE